MKNAWIAALLTCFLLASSPAFASLGEDESSIQADGASAGGTERTIEQEKYTVYEIRTSSGILLREYVAPGGKVFAVTWRGPWMPDLRRLLGKYFEVVRRAQRAHGSKRRPFVIDQPDFVLHSGGRMRSFFGEAHVPSLVPDGIRIEALP